ncbi:MAG: hypothetical protein HPM95_07335 [Alphaproteobacteria bacterium]|nr:hypothetical protein [Alphaproteobacteria bacterium]
MARHSGPDIATGSMLCVGSLGSPGAYSSGMNARGLMLADTQIGARTHRVGWLRYFLMTRCSPAVAMWARRWPSSAPSRMPAAAR